ncbi:TPA: hypothetical protein ACGF3Q_001468 [Vibrio cholerae]
MSDNDYYKRTKEFDPRTRANGLDVEFELDAISAAFDKIPAPREDGQGYDGPIHVGAATAPTHAVQLQQMEAKLGDNTENANRAEEAAERAEEARDIAIEKARQSGEARDEALEAAATVTNIHREQLEKALGVNARVYPRLTNQNLKVGDVIPAPEDTADGLPITHVIVDGNAYAMRPLVSGLVTYLSEIELSADGDTTELIAISKNESVINLADFGVVFDFVFDEDANTFVGTDNLNAMNRAQDFALRVGASLTAPFGKYFAFSGVFTSKVPFDLNGSVMCQLDRSSDSLIIKKTGGVYNGTLYSNMSSGLALSISGSEQIFIGRNKVCLASNLRLSNSFKVRPINDYVGKAVQLRADGASQYISGITLDLVVQGYADGYEEVTTGEAFINSNNISLKMNSCMRYLTQESSLTGNRRFNIGQSEYYLDIQPQAGSEYAMKIQAADNVYKGRIWDGALFQDVSKVVQLVDIQPASPNQGFKTCIGNVIDMFGVNLDRCHGQVETNTINGYFGNNPSNIKDPMSNNRYQSNLNFRKLKLGVNGVEDIFQYQSQVDSFIAGANLRFLTLMTTTNAAGSFISNISPSVGNESNIYVANEDVAAFASTDYVTLTVSLNEGAFPINQEQVDFVGVKMLSPVDNVIFEIRYSGSSNWVKVNEWYGAKRRVFSTRFNPQGGSTNQVRTQTINGMRVRLQNASGVVEVENFFAFSPVANGVECMNPRNAMVFKGNLNIAFSPDQGILFKTPSGEIYKQVVKDGGIPDFERVL